MSIEQAMDRFESAALAAGWEIREERDWSAPRGQEHLYRWDQQPFDYDRAMTLLSERQLLMNDDYLSVLGQWNGLGLRRPSQAEIPSLWRFSFYGFDRALYENDTASWIDDGGKERPVGSRFIFMDEDYHCQIFLNSKGEVWSVYERLEEQLIFHSLENMFPCFTEAVSIGLDFCIGEEAFDDDVLKNDRLIQDVFFTSTDRLSAWDPEQ